MFLLQDRACFTLRMLLCGEAGRSQGRIYLALRHLSQPRRRANLQNCINDTRKSFKKFVGHCSTNRARRGGLSGSSSDADLFIQWDLSLCQRHFNRCGWHAGQRLPESSPTITSPRAESSANSFAWYIYTHVYTSPMSEPAPLLPLTTHLRIHFTQAVLQLYSVAMLQQTYGVSANSPPSLPTGFQALSLPTVPRALPRMRQGLIKVKYAGTELITRKSPSI